MSGATAARNASYAASLWNFHEHSHTSRNHVVPTVAIHAA